MYPLEDIHVCEYICEKLHDIWVVAYIASEAPRIWAHRLAQLGIKSSNVVPAICSTMLGIPELLLTHVLTYLLTDTHPDSTNKVQNGQTY